MERNGSLTASSRLLVSSASGKNSRLRYWFNLLTAMRNLVSNFSHFTRESWSSVSRSRLRCYTGEMRGMMFRGSLRRRLLALLSMLCSKKYQQRLPYKTSPGLLVSWKRQPWHEPPLRLPETLLPVLHHQTNSCQSRMIVTEVT